MASWSQRRKFIYSGSIVAIILVLIGLPTFFYFYKAPTCSDGIKNGDETGIDCGGSCQRLCQNSFLTPVVAWTRLENVAPGLYNVATYIQNLNIAAVAIKVPYHVIVYDDQGIEITEYTGSVTLPPHRNTLAFNGAVSMGKRIPAKALFEFTGAPNWQSAADPLQSLTIGDKKYAEDSGGASLSVTLSDSGVDQIGKTDVYAILYDKDSNALGFSKTVLDSIPAFGSNTAPFTWPMSFDGKVISIEVLPVAEQRYDKIYPRKSDEYRLDTLSCHTTYLSCGLVDYALLHW